jgi:hypothetical protein
MVDYEAMRDRFCVLCVVSAKTPRKKENGSYGAQEVPFLSARWCSVFCSIKPTSCRFREVLYQ